MKIIFTGRDNPFNRGIVHWLSQDHEVISCLFLEPNRFTYRAQWRKIKRRAKRYGWIKAIDELAFHIVDRILIRKDEKRRFESHFPEIFNIPPPIEVPCYDVENIHSEKWLDYIREKEPDIIFSVCGSVIFRPELYTLPKIGTFVLHEGLTPEYKGLHTPIWALMKKEFDYLGYTLLRVNDSIDGGDVLIQGSYSPEDDTTFRQWSFIGHHAIVNGLEDMRKSLLNLEQKGDFEALDLREKERKSHYYTWMGLSDFLKLYFKNYFLKNNK